MRTYSPNYMPEVTVVYEFSGDILEPEVEINEYLVHDAEISIGLSDLLNRYEDKFITEILSEVSHARRNMRDL